MKEALVVFKNVTGTSSKLIGLETTVLTQPTANQYL